MIPAADDYMRGLDLALAALVAGDPVTVAQARDQMHLAITEMREELDTTNEDTE
jgi:hypothetical protein